jgi:hypothetical protein
MSEATSVLLVMSLTGIFFFVLAFLIHRFGAERVVTTIDWSRVSDPPRANRGYRLGMIALGVLQIAWGCFLFFAIEGGHKNDVGMIGSVIFVAILLALVVALIVQQARWQDRPAQWKRNVHR